ncbi:MAG: GYF domain-containing protein [Planctomycetaceae bacterium]
MANEWFYAQGQQEAGPVSLWEVRELAKDGTLKSTDLVWTEGMAEWDRASRVSELADLYPTPPPPPPVTTPPTATPPPFEQAAGKKVAAGICGILLGALGIHKFILGYPIPGVIMLVVSLVSCGYLAIVPFIIGIVEGILYLTKSDEEFYHTYMVNRREWF